MNEDDAPATLRPFVPLVRKWGVTTSDTERYALHSRVEKDRSALDELEQFGRSWTKQHNDIFSEWADREPMTKNKLVAQFYFTLLLLNELQIDFGSSDQADPVAELIAELQASGSTRKDSLRMWAARRLPDYGKQALRALPQLRKACSDPLPGVRAWAHHALARLEGELEAHREAIRQIANEDTDSLTNSFIRSALDELDRTPDQHAIEALRSFCITSQTKEIRRLLSIVSDVDALDHNGKRALEYAVGNSKVDAITLLLEHGADPNLKTKRGKTYLEVANTLRDGKEIVGLLLLHGAEPARKSSWLPRFLEALRRFVS